MENKFNEADITPFAFKDYSDFGLSGPKFVMIQMEKDSQDKAEYKYKLIHVED